MRARAAGVMPNIEANCTMSSAALDAIATSGFLQRIAVDLDQQPMHAGIGRGHAPERLNRGPPGRIGVAVGRERLHIDPRL